MPAGTGLSGQFSDIVGRTTLRWRDAVAFTHRFRLDKNNLAFRRNELNATIGDSRSYAMVGYMQLNRGIDTGIEDLRDREELQLGGRLQFARYWSLFGSTVVDLTDQREDPTTLADGYQPVRHRVELLYEDDCIQIGASWRRDYVDTGDKRRGNSFLLRLALKNLGR
jgi:LPS-assembly protein